MATVPANDPLHEQTLKFPVLNSDLVRKGRNTVIKFGHRTQSTQPVIEQIVTLDCSDVSQ